MFRRKMSAQSESETGVANQSAIGQMRKELKDYLQIYCKNLDREEMQKVESFCDRKKAEDITVLKVHSIQRPLRTEKPGTLHDRWCGQLGVDEKEFSDGDLPKNKVKEEVREKAKDSGPALVLIENRDAEVFRVEVYE